MYAILDEDHNVVEIGDDVLRWASDYDQQSKRRVNLTVIEGYYRVSTVFLGLDHGFGLTPLWFETMVFPAKGHRDLDMERYATWDEAVKGHERMVEKWLNISKEEAEDAEHD